jgi:hypothetical protein
MMIEARQLTSTIETKAYDYAARVDVVPPEKLEVQLDLSKVGMRKGVWAYRLDCAVPGAVYLVNDISPIFSLHEGARVILQMS